MSSFFDHQVKCPKCSHSPIVASDEPSGYVYYCPECKYESSNYDDFELLDPGATKKEKGKTDAKQG